MNKDKFCAALLTHLVKFLMVLTWMVLDGLNNKRCEISKEDSDPVLNAIKTFEKHPNILKIKELSSGCRLSFENVSLENVKKATRELDVSKAS